MEYAMHCIPGIQQGHHSPILNSKSRNQCSCNFCEIMYTIYTKSSTMDKEYKYI